jgi:hypothetical protein
MRTPYRDGVIDVRLSKPETALVQKTQDLMQGLSKMQPIRKMLSDAAGAAEAALVHVLKLAACDAMELLPLMDGIAKTNMPTPPADATTPPASEPTKPTVPPPSDTSPTACKITAKKAMDGKK